MVVASQCFSIWTGFDHSRCGTVQTRSHARVWSMFHGKKEQLAAGMFAVPVTAELMSQLRDSSTASATQVVTLHHLVVLSLQLRTTVGEIRQKVQEWKPE